MYALKANFYPAEEPKNGYIGKADITIANAVRLNNISVFDDGEGKRSLSFATFGKENEHSYVIPSSKEAYAAMLNVVSKAVDAEKNFAFEKGEYGVRFEVRGARVNEPYADGRFNVAVGDFCTLNGISTNETTYTRDGETKSFVAVDLPPVRDSEGHVKLFTDEKGNQRANLQFEGLRNRFKTKDGEEKSVDYRVLMNNMIRKHRNELGQSLDASINEAKTKKSAPSQEKSAPAKEETR